MSSLTSISASRIEQLPGQIRKLVDVRNGQKHATERRFFPATCWPKWSSPTEAYHLIKNTPKVTGFLGFHKKPIPISDAEAAYILHQIQEGIERPKAYRCFATKSAPKTRSEHPTADVSNTPSAIFTGTVSPTLLP